MKEKSVQISNGIDARIAALFVQKASTFVSKITLRIDEKTVSGKSIMGIISLAVLDGNNLTVSADGADEEQASTELANFLAHPSFE